MLDAWNESDATKVRGYLKAALDDNVRFVDPTIDLVGIDAFETTVHEVQARIPGAVYSRISRVDAHHNVYRYHWVIHVGGKLAVQDFDTVAAVDDKVSLVIGFVGDLPLNEVSL